MLSWQTCEIIYLPTFTTAQLHTVVSRGHAENMVFVLGGYEMIVLGPF